MSATSTLTSWAERESWGGRRQTSRITGRGDVHERTGQPSGARGEMKESSREVESTLHTSPPTSTELSDGVREKPWPWRVRLSPAWAEEGELERRRGVCARLKSTAHPPPTAHAAPEMARVWRISSTAGGGGGEEGEGGELGGGGAEGEGGGARGGEGGSEGGGEGASLLPQSEQSEAKGQPEYSAPGPPSSHTPSPTHPCW